MTSNAQRIADIILSNNPEKYQDELNRFAQPPLSFDPYEEVTIFTGRKTIVMELFDDNKYGHQLIPLMLLEGHMGNDPKMFRDLLFQYDASPELLQTWKIHCPKDIHAKDEHEQNLIDIAFKHRSLDKLMWAIDNGVSVDEAKKHPVDNLHKLETDAEREAVLFKLAETGNIQIVDNRPNNANALFRIYYREKERLMRTEDPFGPVLEKLSKQTQSLIWSIRSAGVTGRLSEEIKHIGISDIHRAHACNKLQEMCNPQLWGEHIDKLYKLHFEVHPVVSKRMCEMMREEFDQVERVMLQTPSTTTHSPFDLGDLSQQPKKGGRGNG